MNLKHLLAFAVVSTFLSSSLFAATTTYARRTTPTTPVAGVVYCWDTAVTNAAIGSDSDANGTGMWRYETVVATATDTTNQLGGASPWYALASSDPMVWTTANYAAGRWEGTGTLNATIPQVQPDRFRPSNSTGNFGYLVRMVWVAPQAGTLSLKGTMNLACGSGVAATTVEWAIGKKVGTTYQTPLASGTVNATTANTNLGVAGNAALQNIALNAGDGVYVTHRPTTEAATGGGTIFLDDFGGTYEFTTLSGVSDWMSE